MSVKTDSSIHLNSYRRGELKSRSIENKQRLIVSYQALLVIFKVSSTEEI